MTDNFRRISVSEACTIVSSVCSEECSVVYRYARKLQSAGALPLSRGRSIPGINARQFTRLLIAALVRPRYERTALVVEEIYNLRIIVIPESFPGEKPSAFGEELALNLCLAGADPKKMPPTERDLRRSAYDAHYEICPDFPAAVIHHAGTRQVYQSPGQIPGYWKASIKRSVAVTGRTLVECFDAGLELEHLEPGFADVSFEYPDCF
ncbi:MAG: hypothetical protein AAFU80_07640 [Pseudomonadota bacterium]